MKNCKNIEDFIAICTKHDVKDGSIDYVKNMTEVENAMDVMLANDADPYAINAETGMPNWQVARTIMDSMFAYKALSSMGAKVLVKMIEKAEELQAKELIKGMGDAKRAN